MEQKIRDLIIQAAKASLSQTRDKPLKGRIHKELIEIGEPAIPVLIETIQACQSVYGPVQSKSIRQFSSAVLYLIEGGEEVALPVLIESLKSEKKWVRRNAVSALGNLNKNVMEDAIPSLIHVLLHDPILQTRKAAAVVFGRQMRSESKYKDDVLSAMIPMLQDPSAKIRGHVSEALCVMAAKSFLGKEKKDLIDIAIPMLQDLNGFVRARTAHAMGFIGPDAKNADIYPNTT